MQVKRIALKTPRLNGTRTHSWPSDCTGLLHHLSYQVRMWELGPVSQKSRNFTGRFRVSQFPLYLKNGEDLIRQTSQLFFFWLPRKHFKRWAFQNKRLAVSQMTFRPRKAFGTFEKRAPGQLWFCTIGKLSKENGNGNENVTTKYNLALTQIFRDYSVFFTFYYTGELSWNWMGLRTVLK